MAIFFRTFCPECRMFGKKVYGKKWEKNYLRICLAIYVVPVSHLMTGNNLSAQKITLIYLFD
jgi:hypothetical protein